MKMKLFRHATLHIGIGGLTILVDPLLAAQGALPAIENSPQPRRNPLVELPDEQLVLCADAVLLTHCHRDHLDQAALTALPKTMPLFCQPDDEQRLREAGFDCVYAVEDKIEWRGLQIQRTGGQHGHGPTALAMAPVSGYLLQAAEEPAVYVTGDTVWCSAVEEALSRHKPKIIIAYAGAATFLNDRPITLDGDDLERMMNAAPQAKFAAVHMEAFNHCLLSRAELRRRIADERLMIPQDGEEIKF